MIDLHIKSMNQDCSIPQVLEKSIKPLMVLLPLLQKDHIFFSILIIASNPLSVAAVGTSIRTSFSCWIVLASSFYISVAFLTVDLMSVLFSETSQTFSTTLYSFFDINYNFFRFFFGCCIWNLN